MCKLSSVPESIVLERGEGDDEGEEIVTHSGCRSGL